MVLPSTRKVITKGGRVEGDTANAIAPRILHALHQRSYAHALDDITMIHERLNVLLYLYASVRCALAAASAVVGAMTTAAAIGAQSRAPVAARAARRVALRCTHYLKRLGTQTRLAHARAVQANNAHAAVTRSDPLRRAPEVKRVRRRRGDCALCCHRRLAKMWWRGVAMRIAVVMGYM